MNKPEFILSIQIKCLSHPGIEGVELHPEQIPSTNDKIRIDGIWFNVSKTEWILDNGVSNVIIHLEETKI